MAKNIVVSGAYKGASLVIKGMFSKELRLIQRGILKSTNIALSKRTVKDVGIVDTSTTKSASSAVLRGGAGAILFGPVGIAAALSAKNKKEHQILITFKDNKECVAIVDNEVLAMLQDCILNSTGTDRNFDFYEGREDIEEDDYDSDVSPATPNGSPAPQGIDIASQLQKLADMKIKGLLTDEEFSAAKTTLLSQAPAAPSQVKLQPKTTPSTTYTVVLKNLGECDFAERIEFIKELRAASQLGVREAKEIVDNPPSVVKRHLPKEVAERICEIIDDYGGEPEMRLE